MSRRRLLPRFGPALASAVGVLIVCIAGAAVLAYPAAAAAERLSVEPRVEARRRAGPSPHELLEPARLEHGENEAGQR